MNNKIKNILLTIIFLVLIIGGFLLNFIVKDKKVSVSERRKLKQFPKITINSMLSGKFSNELETYAMDQFVYRDFYRNIKAINHFKILRQKDNNGYFEKNGTIYKQTGILKENEIKKATFKFNNIQEKYLKNNKVYFSIIPDKTYFVKKNELRMNYELLQEIMINNLSNMKYINLLDILNKEDYYKTDTHWRQENLIKIAERISKKTTGKFKLNNIDKKSKGKFDGVYSGQIGMKIKQKDELEYITSPIIEDCTTFNIETDKYNKIYDDEKWKKSSDKYDFFLSGATPIITITNPNYKIEKKVNKNEKYNESSSYKKDVNVNNELIIFRDSFGSSLAPLLIENYSKITLVDIRYISSDYLEKYIDFNNQDVLFLYSTLVLNDASILK